jgi:hypothetical protein
MPHYQVEACVAPGVRKIMSGSVTAWNTPEEALAASEAHHGMLTAPWVFDMDAMRAYYLKDGKLVPTSPGLVIGPTDNDR